MMSMKSVSYNSTLIGTIKENEGVKQKERKYEN